MSRNLPGLDPFSRTGRGLAVLCASKRPCPWAARKDALKPQPRNGHGLFGTPRWSSFRVPSRHPTPTRDSKLDDAHRPSAQPPYSPPKRPALCFWPFSTTWAPFGGPPPPPQLSYILFSFLFFFKLGMGSKPTIGGGGGGKAGRGWDPEVPLFLSARSSFRPFFLFKAISSSSSELSSMRAMTRPRVRTPKNLSGSSSKSEI